MEECLAANSSASLPVPSGELSSTTSKSTGTGRREKPLGERGKVFPLVVGRHNDKVLLHVIEAQG